MTIKINFTGGGTVGHIIPAVNLMRHFSEKNYQVLLVTDHRGNNFIKNNIEFRSYIINTGTITNKNLLKKIFSLLLIFTSLIKSIIILKKEKPDLIVGFGGYVSFPLSFASRFFNLPLVIYENNMVLGKANRYLSSSSKKILLAKENIKKLPEKYKSKTFEVGAILNKNIINISSFKENIKNSYCILVIGGSQGAEIFGKVIPGVIKMVKELGYKIEIKHQCAKGQKNYLTDFYNKNNIKNYVFEFDNNILNHAISSNLAITRGGASTTAELIHTLTPFIAIPLPNSIDNHQYLNAEYYKNKGCCWILDQENFNTKNLFNLIKETIENKNKLENIRINMKKNFNKNVYNNIENQIKEFI